jgi:hypothetical protein
VYLIGETFSGVQLIGAALIIVAMTSAELLPRMLPTRGEVEHPEACEASPDCS